MKNLNSHPFLTKSIHTLILIALIAAPVLTGRAAPAAAAPAADLSQSPAMQSPADAGTPVQQALKESIRERKQLGLPVPASVTYSLDVVSLPAGEAARGQAANPVRITGKTVITFDHPRQAGYEQWPDLIVEETLPPGASGDIRPGNYNQRAREKVEKASPGYWKKHKFGKEPRTITLEEVYEIVPPENAPVGTLMELESLQPADSPADSAYIPGCEGPNHLLGFTIPGPRIAKYIFHERQVIRIFGKEVVLLEVKLGFELDWAFGLRHPARVGLTVPEILQAGTTYALSTSFTTLDCKADVYENIFRVHPGKGKEFAWYFHFWMGLRIIILDQTVVNWGKAVNYDFSKDCMVPSGSGGCAIPYSAREELTPAETGLQWSILGAGTIGIGFTQMAAIGSRTVTADWSAIQGGNRLSSGQITYAGMGNATGFEVTPRPDFPAGPMDISLSGFRYYFDTFVVGIFATFHVQFLKLKPATVSLPIYNFDLLKLSGGRLPYIGTHAGTNRTVSQYALVEIPSSPPVTPQTDFQAQGILGNNEWYRSDVTVTLAAAPGSGSDLATYYSFDNTAWSQYAGPLTLSGDGVTTLTYYSKDSQSEEPHQSAIIKIDRTAPVITILSPTAGAYPHTGVIGLEWTLDEPVSGIAEQQAQFDGSPALNDQVVDLFALALGAHSLVVAAMDEAGNRSEAQVAFFVIADIDSLQSVLERVYANGWITKEGTYKSLKAKLNAAQKSIQRGKISAARGQLKAFLNHLEAQNGKSISPEAYALLKGDGAYVRDHLP